MEIILVTWNDVGNAERTAVNAYQVYSDCSEF